MSDIIVADDFGEGSMTVAEAVCADDCELLVTGDEWEGPEHDDHSLDEFGGAATYSGP